MEKISDLYVLDDGRPDRLATAVGVFTLLIGVGIPIAVLINVSSQIVRLILLVSGTASGSFSIDIGSIFMLPVVLLFCLPFAMAGVFMIFRRNGMWIDKAKGVLVSWSKTPSLKGGRLAYPRVETATPLDVFDRLEIRRITRRTGHGSRRYFAVDLVGPEKVEGVQYWTAGESGPPDGVRIGLYFKVADAERRAQRVSAYLSLPITRCPETQNAH